MIGLEYAAGDKISIHNADTGETLKDAFEVVSVDPVDRATCLKITEDIVLSKALSLAVRATEATSAEVDHENLDQVILHYGYRPDSFQYMRDAGEPSTIR